MAKMVETEQPIFSSKDLPVEFTVKYLGNEPAKGLWGMKHTRKPVDHLVARAKNLPPTKILSIVKLKISTKGLDMTDITDNKKTTTTSSITQFPIDNISYGVQDLIYTRVFSMIYVNEKNLRADSTPFICHSFVCDSRDQARKITYALAAAFHEYGKSVKESGSMDQTKKKFAIDLRSPDEQHNTLDEETEA